MQGHESPLATIENVETKLRKIGRNLDMTGRNKQKRSMERRLWNRKEYTIWRCTVLEYVGIGITGEYD